MKFSNLFHLSGKVAIVTGGANGIGKATAIMLAKAGANIAIGDFKLEDAENTAIVEQFLRDHPEFYLDPAGSFLPIPRAESMVTLWPQRDGTDGFFIARMSRKAEGVSTDEN